MASVPETLLLLAGIIVGFLEILHYSRSAGLEKEYMVFLCLLMVTMLLGFSWFIYSYVMASTKVLKATYMLQVLILLVFPTAELLERLRMKSRGAYVALIVVLAVAFLHNVPAMITRYNVFSFL